MKGLPHFGTRSAEMSQAQSLPSGSAGTRQLKAERATQAQAPRGACGGLPTVEGGGVRIRRPSQRGRCLIWVSENKAELARELAAHPRPEERRVQM